MSDWTPSYTFGVCVFALNNGSVCTSAMLTLRINKKIAIEYNFVISPSYTLLKFSGHKNLWDVLRITFAIVQYLEEIF